MNDSSRRFVWRNIRHEIRIAPFRRRGTRHGVIASNPWLEQLPLWPGSIQYEPCPPAVRKMFYEVIADWAVRMAAHSIGGPVVSGAMLASGIAAVSGRLDSFLIDKQGAPQPRRHPPAPIRGRQVVPFVVVDDVICTAGEMEHALETVGIQDLAAVLVMDNRFRLESKPEDIPLVCRALRSGLVYGISYQADPPHKEW